MLLSQRPLRSSSAPDARAERRVPCRANEEADSLFPSQSMIRRVNGEALVLLGGGRSILLQLAHPLIAAGVAGYSDFQSDPLARLFRTLSFMNAMLYDRDRRQGALQRFHHMHAHIRGRLPHAAGRYPVGTPYAGDDPNLKLWVHATFVETCLKSYEQFVRPLAPDECRRYYADSLKLAALLEVPHDVLPQTLEEFRTYMAAMRASDRLAVTPTARRLAEGVLYPDVGIVPAASAALLRLTTAGMLPEPLRAAYGLKWGRRQQLLLNSLSGTTRRLRPWAPRWVWQSPLLAGSLPRMLLGRWDRLPRSGCPF